MKLINFHTSSILKSFLFCFVFAGGHVIAQTVNYQGTVVDASNSEPLPNAVVLLNTANAEPIQTVTDFDGVFHLDGPQAGVTIEVRFIGFEDAIISNYTVSGNTVNLGEISLKAISTNLTEVEITAERSTVEFRMDKRVFNVGADISSTGMGALDVLNNVPSVNVDIEGSVSLRGNSGVQILINGKPSVLADEGSNALGSITADMIESIEVITNPSAKYQAEGTSGIINIILKKEEKRGLNGSISLNTGYPNNHSIGGSINFRTEDFNFFTQFGAGYRTYPNYGQTRSFNSSDSTTIESSSYGDKNEQFYNITIGTDYYINDFNTITLSGSLAYEFEENPSSTDFYLYDGQGNLTSAYSRYETTSALNPKYRYDLQYEKQFRDDKDHKLLFSTLGNFFGKDQTSEFTNEYELGAVQNADQRTATDFYQTDYTFKLDYTDPLNDFFSLEAGSMYEINDVGNNYSVSNYSGGSWLADSSLTNDFTYLQKVFGIYGTLAYERESWGLKVGLRAENTDLITRLETTEQENTQYYTNLFPSFHAHYKFSNAFSLQAGYSQRIYRPRLWDLNPFFNIQNNYNIRTGNPLLQPEYADSYELTGVFIQPKYSLNASLYYLYTTNVMERVSYYEDGVNITKPINVGTRDKVGIEVNGKYTVNSWFNMHGDFNYGWFQRNGEFENQSFDFTNHQWSTKITTAFSLPAGVELEITSNYNSSVQTVQGTTSGFGFIDAGVRKTFLNGKIVVNAAVRDIFASRIRETVIDTPDYYLFQSSKRGRFITLGISYGFGKGEAMSYSGGRRH